MNKILIKLSESFIIVALIFIHMSCSDMEREYVPKLISYPDFKIIDFYPKEGTTGTEVSIKGVGFGDYAKAARVYFNGVLANQIIEFSDTIFKVIVPEDALSGKLEINIWTHKNYTESEFAYIPGAKITSLSTYKALAGEQMTIYGSRFGNSLNGIEVYFEKDVKATLLSVQDDQIALIIPQAKTGNIILKKGAQVLFGPLFYFPINVQYLFDNDGDLEGWFDASSGKTAKLQVSDGCVNILYDMNQSEFNRIDFRANNVMVDPVDYPIIAIKWEDAPTRAFRFHTSLGNYNQKTSFNHDGILAENVFYYDLRNGFNAGAFDVTQPSTFQYMQWIVSENISTGKTKSKIHWIRNFKSLAELQAFLSE